MNMTDKIIKLIKYGNTLGPRNIAKIIREDIINIIKENDNAVIDFYGVEFLTNSFADELVAKLFMNIGRSEFSGKIKMVNASEKVRKMIVYCINERIKT